MKTYDCDLCGSSELEAIEVLRRYTGDWDLHVCTGCGFVQIARRRTPQELQHVWAEELYRADEGERLSDKTYTARMPAVKARQTFAADFIDEAVSLAGKTVCDIGAGEGQFLDMIKAPPYGAEVFAIEPSADNCRLMSAAGHENFPGTIEDYMATEPERRFDVVTLIWTLENCQSASGVLSAAYDLLKPGGHVAVATGSRILVPFKKPLHYYLGTSSDIHPFHFSANALRGLYAESGFEVTDVNRFIDSDYLVTVGRKTERRQPIPWQGDDWKAVKAFFERWDAETQNHYKDS